MPKAPVITPQAEDFPRWYQDLLSKAELADNGPVRGTMVIRPYAYALWERMQAGMDGRIKVAGAQNVYLPLFIPEGHLRREAEHVDGFSPELAVVTHAGGKQLEEPVVVRPTSETVFGEFMAKWVTSHRDLPLLLNQWGNVVRWELRPRLFLRTSEFLWQEGHTAHASRGDATAYAELILHQVYADFMRTELAMPVLPGRKTRRERFAGAINTMTLEAMMGDGKALQMGTSHELGQNFSRAFDIGFTDAEQQHRLCWTTSWGSSTRMLGGLIMCHGDDAGLRVPPKLAATQVVVTLVKTSDRVAAVADQLVAELRDAGVRVLLDDRVDTPYGRRAVDHELKGIPVRIEVGPRDLESDTVTVVRRIPGTKQPIALGEVTTAVTAALETDHQALYDEALARREDRTVDVGSVDEAVEAAATGWARVPWRLLGDEGEARIAGRGVTVRCLLNADGSVPTTDDPAEAPDLIAVLARAY